MVLPYLLPQLTSDSLNFIEAIRIFSPRFALFYETAYSIGCRFEELTDITRFQVSGINNIIFQPSKGNKERHLLMSELPSAFVQMVKQQESYFKNIDYGTNSRYFAQYWPNYPIIYEGFNKVVRFYCFRYRYIWQLASDGYSTLEMQKIMGEIEPANILGYVNKELFIMTPDN